MIITMLLMTMIVLAGPCRTTTRTLTYMRSCRYVGSPASMSSVPGAHSTVCTLCTIIAAPWRTQQGDNCGPSYAVRRVRTPHSRPPSVRVCHLRHTTPQQQRQQQLVGVSVPFQECVDGIRRCIPPDIVCIMDRSGERSLRVCVCVCDTQRTRQHTHRVYGHLHPHSV